MEISYVFAEIAPAFCHWLEKPTNAGWGTRSNWSSVVCHAYVRSRPRFSKKTKLIPASRSVVNSGLSAVFPRLTGKIAPPEMPKVSYCAWKFGRPPAVPSEKRSFSSSIASMFQKSSCVTRQANEPR